MTSITRSKLSDLSLAQHDPQDPAHLARTLRRIKRRLLLEQCGVSLPSLLQSAPQVLLRPGSQDAALPYALQSTPQVLLRQDSQDTTECTMGVGMSKIHSSMGRVSVMSEVSPALPSME